MPVGNDIIDLLDRESDPAALHPRYLERVLTGAERAAVNRSCGRGRGSDWRRLGMVGVELWSRWAAKEATFKALAAQCPELVFSPRAFSTSLMEPTADGQRRGWVEHGGRRIPVLLHHSGSLLHAIAATASELDHGHLLCAVAPLMSGTDASLSVRRLATRCLARYRGCDEGAVQIRGRRPPALFIGERPAARSLSLSHHGAWVGFAMSLDRAALCHSRRRPNPSAGTATS